MTSRWIRLLLISVPRLAVHRLARPGVRGQRRRDLSRHQRRDPRPVRGDRHRPVEDPQAAGHGGAGRRLPDAAQGPRRPRVRPRLRPPGASLRAGHPRLRLPPAGRHQGLSELHRELPGPGRLAAEEPQGAGRPELGAPDEDSITAWMVRATMRDTLGSASKRAIQLHPLPGRGAVLRRARPHQGRRHGGEFGRQGMARPRAAGSWARRGRCRSSTCLRARRSAPTRCSGFASTSSASTPARKGARSSSPSSTKASRPTTKPRCWPSESGSACDDRAALPRIASPADRADRRSVPGGRMKIAIVGAGAIGGLLGARLSLAGEDVAFIARNRNLLAIEQHGFRLVEDDGRELHAPRVRAYADGGDAGPQDAVLLAVKAHQVKDVLPAMQGLLGPETAGGDDDQRPALVVLPAPCRARTRTGCSKASTRAARSPRRSTPERVIGSVVYPAAELVEPGKVRADRGQPLHPRRARRPAQPADRGAVAGADARRLQGADQPRTSAARSGSSSGAPSASTRSARSATPRSKASAATRTAAPWSRR